MKMMLAENIRASRKERSLTQEQLSEALGGDEARDTLIKARELAAFFDASPSYDESAIRFVGRVEGDSAHDDMGATATEAVGHTVAQFENEELTALWKSITEQEGLHEQERN